MLEDEPDMPSACRSDTCRLLLALDTRRKGADEQGACKGSPAQGRSSNSDRSAAVWAGWQR